MTETFTIRDVAQMLGVSKSYLRRQIQAKRLRVKKPQPQAQAGKRSPWRISRQHLVDWLVSSGFDTHQMRSRLNADGILLLVNLDPALVKAITGHTKTVQSLFEMGRVVASQRCWGVVIDLDNEGPQQTCRSIRDFASKADRPELIGLHGDEGLATPDPPFDVLLPKSLGTEKLVRSIQMLRPKGSESIDG